MLIIIIGALLKKIFWLADRDNPSKGMNPTIGGIFLDETKLANSQCKVLARHMRIGELRWLPLIPGLFAILEGELPLILELALAN